MTPEAPQAALRRAIEDARTERQMSQRELGAAVGHDEGGDAYPQQTVADWLNGRVSIPPARVFAIERAFRLRPGTLSKLDGYVPVGEVPTMTPEEAIEADPTISPGHLGMLRAVLSQARLQTQEERDRRKRGPR
jgi:transcriptional regulator with XRE-family HTH domain